MNQSFQNHVHHTLPSLIWRVVTSWRPANSAASPEWCRRHLLGGVFWDFLFLIALFCCWHRRLLSRDCLCWTLLTEMPCWWLPSTVRPESVSMHHLWFLSRSELDAIHQVVLSFSQQCRGLAKAGSTLGWHLFFVGGCTAILHLLPWA